MNFRRVTQVSVIAATALVSVLAATQVAAGAEHAARPAAVPPAGPVSAHPVTTTPHLLPTASPAQQIRQLVQCGGTMYAVGMFKTIEQGTTSYSRFNAMSFKATSPYTVSTWAPKIKGEVNSIAFNGTNCTDAFVGGSFTSVNGFKVSNFAEVNTKTGRVVKNFPHTASGTVDTLLSAQGRLLVGGEFKSINGSSAEPYFASLSPATGAVGKYLNLHVSGNYQFPGVDPNPTKVYNQQLSHSGTLDLVEGDFTSVGGKPRQQIFMLSVGPKTTKVTGWTSPEFDGSKGNLPSGYPYQCAVSEPFYIRAAAWSPNDQTVYLADTGYHPWNLTTTVPRSGLCDSASAFPSTQKSVTHLWINYTGCDSLYSAAADASTAYFAGHERWSQNPGGCDEDGGGTAVPAPGFEGLSPSTGALTFNPTRARGLGADDLLVTQQGLWIASDDFDDSQMCGGVQNLSGICLLPYSPG
jgi:hypothetical protein